VFWAGCSWIEPAPRRFEGELVSTILAAPFPDKQISRLFGSAIVDIRIDKLVVAALQRETFVEIEVAPD
jgi:hypothetical protein